MRDHTRPANSPIVSLQATPLSLHIERGRTLFPDRPIDSSPFLIGSGPGCHLQLGGEIPAMHCRICHAEGSVTIESLTQLSPLVVNGQAVEQTRLTPGSIIEIGPFQFRLIAPVAPVSLEQEPLVETSVELADFPLEDTSALPGVDETTPDPADLTVHGLVERLETALERLESLEHRRRAGLASLLEKVIEVAADAAQNPSQRRSA